MRNKETFLKELMVACWEWISTIIIIWWSLALQHPAEYCWHLEAAALTSGVERADLSPGPQRCCAFLDSRPLDYEQLLRCIVDANDAGGSSTSNSVVFATFVSPEIYSYALRNALFNQFYFSSHSTGRGGDVIPSRCLSPLTGDDYFPDDRRWNKIRAIPMALRGWASAYEFVVFIDADLIINNWNFDVHSIILEYGGDNNTDLILASDEIDMANTGFMVVRNSAWSVSFFDRWWSLKGSPHTSCDQHVLNLLLQQLATYGDSSQKVRIVAASLLNSKWPVLDHFHAGDPVLHLMGETSETRTAVAEYLVDGVCGSSLRGSDVLTDVSSHITPVKLKQLKLTAMMTGFEQAKTLCGAAMLMMMMHPAEQECELMRRSINQLCSPVNLQGDSSIIDRDQCLTLVREAQGVHHTILDHHRHRHQQLTTPGAALSTQRKLFHVQQLSMLLFDELKLAVGGVEKTAVAKQCLHLLDETAAMIDMSSAMNRAYIHHKRCIVFGSLAEYEHSQSHWERAVSMDMIALSEVASALESLSDDTLHTLHAHAHAHTNAKDFPGYVLTYSQCASRLSVAYFQLGRLQDAHDWVHAALHNVEKLSRESSSEERLVRNELLGLRLHCARICASLSYWDEYDAQVKEVQALQRLLSVV